VIVAVVVVVIVGAMNVLVSVRHPIEVGVRVTVRVRVVFRSLHKGTRVIVVLAQGLKPSCQPCQHRLSLHSLRFVRGGIEFFVSL
jgi:hypothetical protein